MNFLQQRINELNSAIINIVDNRVNIKGFYNEQMLLRHLEKNIDNCSSKGIYEYAKFNFNKAKTNALFIVQKSGVEIKKVKYIHILKEALKLRDSNNKEMITITKNVFGEEYLVKTEKDISLLKNEEELKNFLKEKYQNLPNIRSEAKMAFAVIDFEIANSNYNSACSLGIVTIEGLQIVNKEYFLIQPPGMSMDPEMTKIHGLTKDELETAPTFAQIWPKIKKYFTGDYIIAAHNAYFDVNVLKNCLSEEIESEVDFIYFDSIQYTNPLCVGQGTSLADRLAYFNIELLNAHNALDDAIATAELIIQATLATKYKYIEQFLLRNNIPVKEFIELNKTTKFFKRNSNSQKFNTKKLNNIIPETESFDVNHPFYNKNIVFTGDLTSYSRREAAQAVVNLGGIIKNSVSNSTDYLIIGKQDPTLVGEKGVSSKELRAAELIEKGKKIKIIDEKSFLELLNMSLVFE